MKIYFSGSIKGGRTHESTFLEMVTYLENCGHHVLSIHVARTDLWAEYALPAKETFERDMKWVEESDVVIAEVSTPSLGVGYEICHALQHSKPTLCFYKSGTDLSLIILGNSHPLIDVVEYHDFSAIKKVLDSFLSDRS